MRFGLNPNVSQIVLDTQGQAQCVTFQNTSGATVYLADDQAALDTSANANGGVPQYGFVILAGTPPFNIATFNGKFAARSPIAGASIEVTSKPICACGS